MLFPFDLGDVLTKLEYASKLNFELMNSLAYIHSRSTPIKVMGSYLEVALHFKVPHIPIHILKITKFSFLFPYLILAEIFSKDLCVCKLGFDNPI
jgi:hypothetical protein